MYLSVLDRNLIWEISKYLDSKSLFNLNLINLQINENKIIKFRFFYIIMYSFLNINTRDKDDIEEFNFLYKNNIIELIRDLLILFNPLINLEYPYKQKKKSYKLLPEIIFDNNLSLHDLKYKIILIISKPQINYVKYKFDSSLNRRYLYRFILKKNRIFNALID